MADKLDGGAIVANTIPGTKIQSGTITTTQLAPAIVSAVTVPLHPKISSIVYPGNDTAANTGGGDSIVIRGSGFGTNVQVYINGTAAPSVTRNNANAVTITTAAQSAGTYLVYLINTDDGGTAILVPGIQYSGMPTWVTTSPLTGQEAAVAWSISLSATGDSPITYALQAGSSLPAGITLAANGLISGTMTSPPENDTTYNFTVVATDPQSQDTPKAFSVSVTVVVDPQFQYTTLLLQADGTNNGNNHAFLDSSNNNFTITRNGNATQGSFTPFSPTGWSNYFSGSTTFVSAPANAAFSYGTGDFTYEAWIYPTADGTATTYRFIMGAGGSGQADQWLINNTGNQTLVYGDGVSAFTTTNKFTLNAWNHVALSRNSGTLRIFINGVLGASGASTASITLGSSQTFYVGNRSGGADSPQQAFVGYMSNVRVLKGVGLYTANFTPPTTPLTAISNTSLLTCQSNRFVDNSPNNFAITRGGDTSIQAFSPFATTTAYSPATHGGAAFFDGSGDYLETTSSQIIPSGNFTIEAWAYITSSNSTQTIVAQGTGVGDGARTWMGIENSSGAKWAVQVGGTQAISSVTPVLNAWHYLAMVYSGSTIKMYLNGTEIASASSTTNASNTTLKIGTNWGGYITTGFLSNIRISNTARTISAVPSSLLAADANTVFLANFTNAQIYDADASIVLETVGDAKVNTAIKKFGAGSIAFDGTGDYLKFPVSADLFNPYRGEYTVEMWVYPVSLASGGAGSSRYGTLMCQQALGSSIQWGFGFNSSGNLVYTYWNGSSTVQITSNGPAIAANTWSHVGFTYTSSGIRLFTNGLLTSATAMTGTPSTSTTESIFIGIEGRTGGSELYYNGYIDDLRISKGLSRYNYNFTPPTRAFSTKGGTQTLTADEYFDYTTLLLPGNGTNNQNNHTFLDSSNNNFTITRNGNATQGTFSPFSQTGWSNLFDATGKYLSVAYSSAAFNLTGDFTVECWINPTNLPSSTGSAAQSYARIWSFGTYNASNGLGLEINSNDSGNLRRLVSWYNGTQYGLSGNNIITPNQWYHIAVVRSGTTITCYVNGVATGTITGASAAVNRSQPFYIASLQGLESDSSAAFAGHISNLRVLNGTAAYTSNFTPSTTPLTAVANTTLLTCQSNRFIDVSNTAATITAANTPSVQAFSPFAPTASYAAANVGGSGYFDGSGDYLVSSSNTALQQGTGDYTYECWVYHTNTSGQQTYFARSTAGNYNGVYFYKDTSNTVGVYYTTQIATGNVTIVSGQWYHLAAARSSGRLRLFVNGVLAANVADTTNLTESVVVIGADANGSSPFNGYISGARVLKSNGLYTAAFTPPTAPLTNVANTSLLCNFTNAGITDATAKNVLETVGDAKISTVQSKFGGSSMLFDGSGDRLTIPFTSDLLELGIGGQNFTVEAWVYPTNAMASAGQILSKGGGTASWSTSSGAQYQWTIISSAASWNFNSSGSPITVNSGTVTLNTWQHLAVTYDGTTTRTFLNGFLQSTSTSSYTAPSTRNLQYIGMTQSGGYTQEYFGYIDDFRITKGIARYTQNFAPPTTAHLTR